MRQARIEGLARRRFELAVDGPVFLRPEALDLVFALADDAQRDLEVPRPAERLPGMRRHSTGDNVKPTKKSRARRAR